MGGCGLFRMRTAAESPGKVTGTTQEPCRPWTGFLLRLSTLRQYGRRTKENGMIWPRFWKPAAVWSQLGSRRPGK